MATAEAPAQAADPRARVTATRLVILGAGEHARVVAEAAEARPEAWNPVEVVDAAGEPALVAALAETPAKDRPTLVLGFGGPPPARRGTAAAMGDGATWATIVHPAAWVSPSARLEPGSVILAGAVVNAGATVGQHAIVNSRVVVEHDVRIGAFAHLAPGVTVGGGTTIGEGATIGLGAAVRDHIAIGAGATVGMGAVVVADVPDGATVLGVPARPEIRLVTDELARCIVRRDASIRDALDAIDRGAGGIVLVVDESGRLVAIATDGDLRRALLAGRGLDDPLGDVANERFVAVDAGQSRVDALDLMRGRRISAIPAVDAAGRPVALHLLAGFLRHAPRDNRAVIMAGGLGTRLRPLTEDVPKPMLRVAGRPILERIVLHLVGFGIERISISVGYLAEVIEHHFGDGTDFGATIDYLREDEPLGTAGALGLLPELPTAPLLVVNGDLITSVDVDAMLRSHAHGGFAATIGTRRYLHTVPFGCIVRDGERVTSIEEKPTLSREVNAGIYVLDPWVAGLVERGERATMLDVLAGVLERGKTVGAFEVDDDWLDVGQREQLRLAREGA